MMDFRPIISIVGILLCVLATAMIIPAVVDAAVGNLDWQVFAASATFTLFIGVTMFLSSRSGWSGFSLRQAFVMTNQNGCSVCSRQR